MLIRHCRSFRWLFAFGVLTVLGCQGVEIEEYTTPKPVPNRLLVAIVPHKDSTWYFKLVGPAKVVANHKGEFDAFLRSVRFTQEADKPIAWTVPRGWKDEGKDEVRKGNFLPDPADPSLELTVFEFPDKAGSVPANVNRWRSQLSLPPLDEAEVDEIATRLRIGKQPAQLVDMTGYGTGRSRRMAPLAGRPIKGTPKPLPQGGPAAGLKYTTPEGWRKLADPGDFFLRAFEVRAGDQVARAGVSTAGGDVLLNVNRWRRQLGLSPIDDEQLARTLRHIKVAGTSADYVDIVSPSSGGSRQRTLAVILPRGEENLFFTLKGPDALVTREQAAFETFVQSIHFEDGKGGNDE